MPSGAYAASSDFHHLRATTLIIVLCTLAAGAAQASEAGKAATVTTALVPLTDAQMDRVMAGASASRLVLAMTVNPLSRGARASRLVLAMTVNP